MWGRTQYLALLVLYLVASSHALPAASKIRSHLSLTPGKSEQKNAALLQTDAVTESKSESKFIIIGSILCLVALVGGSVLLKGASDMLSDRYHERVETISKDQEDLINGYNTIQTRLHDQIVDLFSTMESFVIKCYKHLEEKKDILVGKHDKWKIKHQQDLFDAADKAYNIARKTWEDERKTYLASSTINKVTTHLAINLNKGVAKQHEQQKTFKEKQPQLADFEDEALKYATKQFSDNKVADAMRITEGAIEFLILLHASIRGALTGGHAWTSNTKISNRFSSDAQPFLSKLDELAGRFNEGVDKIQLADSVAKAMENTDQGVKVVQLIANALSKSVDQVSVALNTMVPFVSFALYSSRIGLTLFRMKTDLKYRYGPGDLTFLRSVLDESTRAMTREYCRTIYGVLTILDNFFRHYVDQKTVIDQVTELNPELSGLGLAIEILSETVSPKFAFYWHKEKCGCFATMEETLDGLKPDGKFRTSDEYFTEFEARVQDKARMIRQQSIVDIIFIQEPAAVSTTHMTQLRARHYSPASIPMSNAVSPYTEMNPFSPISGHVTSDLGSILRPRYPETGISAWYVFKKDFIPTPGAARKDAIPIIPEAAKEPITHIISVPLACGYSSDSPDAAKRTLLQSLGYELIKVQQVPSGKAREHTSDCHNNMKTEAALGDIAKGSYSCCHQVEVWVKRGEALSGIRQLNLFNGDLPAPSPLESSTQPARSDVLVSEVTRFSNVYCPDCTRPLPVASGQVRLQFTRASSLYIHKVSLVPLFCDSCESTNSPGAGADSSNLAYCTFASTTQCFHVGCPWKPEPTVYAP